MRTKKAILNIFTSLLYQMVVMVSGLIVPRLILEAYGSACNGIISSAVQFFSVISLLTLGLTGATRVELYKSLAHNDVDATANIMHSTNRYMRRVAYVLVAYTIVLAFVYPYISNTDFPSEFIFMIILAVGVGQFFEYFLGLPYRILLQADQKNYIEYIVMICVCITYTILSCVMIPGGTSIVGVKLMSAVVSMCGLLAISFYAKNKYRLCGNKNRKIIELPQRKAAALHSVANLVHQNSALVILTFFADVKVISVYSVYYYVIGQIKKIMGSFSDGLEAAFGNLWAKKEYEILKKRFSIYEFFVFSIVIVVFSCVWNLIIPFISLYTKGVNDVNYIRPIFAIIITIAELIYCIRQPYTTLIFAAGKYRETKNIAIVEAVINVLVSVVLGMKYNLYGVALGLLVANLVRTLYYVWFTSKVIVVRTKKSVLYRISYLLVTLIICIAVGNRLVNMIVVENWMMWILAGILLMFSSGCIVVLMTVLMERKLLYEIVEIIKFFLNKK